MGEREGDWIQVEVNVSSKLLVFIKLRNYLETKHREDWDYLDVKHIRLGENLKTVFKHLNRC